MGGYKKSLLKQASSLPIKAFKVAANAAIATACLGAGAALVVALYTAPIWVKGRD